MRSRGGRVALVAAAAAALVVAFVVARPSDDGDGASRPSSPGPSENRGGGAGEEVGEGRGPADDAGAGKPEITRIRVRDGRPAGGPATIDVRKEEVVRLVVTSDAADHVHVHGYDLLRDVGPGRAARLRFAARVEGVFEVELEESHTSIATLEVRP